MLGHLGCWGGGKNVMAEGGGLLPKRITSLRSSRDAIWWKGHAKWFTARSHTTITTEKGSRGKKRVFFFLPVHHQSRAKYGQGRHHRLERYSLKPDPTRYKAVKSLERHQRRLSPGHGPLNSLHLRLLSWKQTENDWVDSLRRTYVSVPFDVADDRPWIIARPVRPTCW
jgi:hypothetical protein